MLTTRRKCFWVLLASILAAVLIACAISWAPSALRSAPAAAEEVTVAADDTNNTSLQDAIDAAGTAATTITLESNFTENITIAEGQNITLNLDSNDIAVAGGSAITNNGNLIIQGTINAVVSTEDEAGYAVNNAGTLTIEGGYFKNDLSNTGSISISGGRFATLIPASYLAENCSIGTYISFGNRGYNVGGAPVAEITLDGVRYVFATISNAATNAAGGTVTLIADVEQTNFITLDESVTLDLNGHDITYAGTLNNNLISVTGENVVITNSSEEESKLINKYGEGGNEYSVIHSEGANLTIENVTIESNGNGIVFLGNATPAEAVETDSSTYNTLNLNNASVSAYALAISGNGSSADKYSGTVINVNNSTLTAQQGPGIYQPQYGILNINGEDTVIEGSSGIEVRAGILNVNAGTIKADWPEFAISDNAGGGSSVDGAAIVVSQHSTNLPIKVTLSGGTYSSVSTDGLSVYEADLLNDVATDEIDISITGGTYSQPVESENLTGFILNGTFSEAVSASYVAGDSVLYPAADGTYKVVAEEDFAAEENTGVAQVGNAYYATLQEAINNAADGDTITLLADIKTETAIRINRAVVLDLNGCDITGGTTSSAITSIASISASGVTITNSSDDESVVGNDYYGTMGVSISSGLTDIVLSNITVNMNGHTTGQLSAVQTLSPVVIDNVNITVNAIGSITLGVLVASPDVEIVNSTIEVTRPAEYQDYDHAAYGAYLIQGYDSSLVMKNSIVKSDDSGVMVVGDYGNASASDAIEADSSEYTSFTVIDSTIEAVVYGVVGNGANHGTVINIENTVITVPDSWAIYHPQYGILNISGNNTVITGGTAIELRAGKATIEGGTFISTGDFETSPNGNGTTVYGAALAVSQHTTDLPIDVIVSGGTFVAEGANGKAVYEVDLQGDTVDNIEISVTGGTFNGGVESQNVASFIAGGSFSELPDETLLADSFETVEYDGYYVVFESTETSGDVVIAGLEAQADVRVYLSSLGFAWSDITALAGSDSNAAAVTEAYEALSAATSLAEVAIGRLAAFDAADSYYSYISGLRAEAVSSVNAAAEDANIAVPTYIISAINGAASAAEIETYETLGLAEIADAAAQLAQAEEDIAALSGKIDALSTAVGRIEESLGDIAGLSGVVDEIKAALADAVASLGNASSDIEDISAMVESIQKLQIIVSNTQSTFIDTVESALASIKNTLSGLGTSEEIEKLQSAADAIAEAVSAYDGNFEGLAGIAEEVGALQGAVDSLTDEVTADTGMSGEMIGLYVIVCILAVLVIAVLVLTLLKRRSK